MPGLSSRGSGAVLGSVLAHAIVVALSAWVAGDVEPELESYGLPDDPVAVSMLDLAELAPTVAPVGPPAPGDPVETVLGPADSVSFDPASPFPRADLDVPDRRAAT